MSALSESMDHADRLEAIFLPDAARRREEVRTRQGRFVHYTSAEAAHCIIRASSVRMRNITCMNDFRGIHHGFYALNNVLAQSAVRDELFSALHACNPNVSDRAI